MPDYVALNPDPFSAHQLLLRRCAGAGTILDAGCSAGVLARELVKSGSIVDGIEYDAEAAGEAAAVCRRVLVGDLETMPIDLLPGAYDVVLMADVVEHLRNPVAVLARLRPFLAPGGRIVLSTPNVANWTLRLLHLAGRWEYAERGLMDRTHVHFFTRRTLDRALAEAGYRVLAHDVTVPLPVLRRPPFSGFAHALGGVLPGFLAYQLIAEAASEDPIDPQNA